MNYFPWLLPMALLQVAGCRSGPPMLPLLCGGSSEMATGGMLCALLTTSLRQWNNVLLP